MAIDSRNPAYHVDELAEPLIRFLSRRVKNNADARDIAQEAFLRMHKFQQTSNLANARAFLFRTANNLAVDYFRREQVHDKFLSTEAIPDPSDEGEFAPSAERTVSAEEQLNRVYEIVNGLPPKVRKAFLLHRSNDLSYSEIAHEMGVSNSMVEKYMIQALRTIRSEIGTQ